MLRCAESAEVEASRRMNSEASAQTTGIAPAGMATPNEYRVGIVLLMQCPEDLDGLRVNLASIPLVCLFCPRWIVLFFLLLLAHNGT